MDEMIEERSVMDEIEGLSFPNNVTQFDIDEAIDQILASEGNGNVHLDGMEGLEDNDDNDGEASGSGSKTASSKNAVGIVENAIIEALEDAISDDLKVNLLEANDGDLRGLCQNAQ